jgi:hypothetical protein
VSRPRVLIPQRIRIYLGCEGPSEQSYGKRLNQIADAAGLHLYLDNDVLQPGGGDPLELVKLAIVHIEQKRRKRGDFAHRAILLDRDKLSQNREWESRITRLAQQNQIHLIWQDTCHESFLLRHLEQQTPIRPPSTELALQALKRIWPEYEKGMPATKLAARIDLAAVLRASSVELGLATFLRQIGILRS